MVSQLKEYFSILKELDYTNCHGMNPALILM